MFPSRRSGSDLIFPLRGQGYPGSYKVLSTEVLGITTRALTVSDREKHWYHYSGCNKVGSTTSQSLTRFVFSLLYIGGGRTKYSSHLQGGGCEDDL